MPSPNLIIWASLGVAIVAVVSMVAILRGIKVEVLEVEPIIMGDWSSCPVCGGRWSYVDDEVHTNGCIARKARLARAPRGHAKLGSDSLGVHHN